MVGPTFWFRAASIFLVLRTVYSELMKQFLLNFFGLLLLNVLPAMACQSDPPVARLEDGVRIEARAQTGVRIEGRKSTPRFISAKPPAGSPDIPLKIQTTVTQIRDVRPIWKRAAGGSPDYRDVVVPRQIEIRPEQVLEQDLRYEATLEEDGATSRVELLFRGGMVKSRGCGGGEAAVTPLKPSRGAR